MWGRDEQILKDVMAGRGSVMVLRCQTEYEICSHVYDPERGDPEIGIEPGTPLEAVPVDWICPRCRVQTIEKQKEGGSQGG